MRCHCARARVHRQQDGARGKRASHDGCCCAPNCFATTCYATPFQLKHSAFQDRRCRPCHRNQRRWTLIVRIVPPNDPSLFLSSGSRRLRQRALLQGRLFCEYIGRQCELIGRQCYICLPQQYITPIHHVPFVVVNDLRICCARLFASQGAHVRRRLFEFLHRHRLDRLLRQRLGRDNLGKHKVLEISHHFIRRLGQLGRSQPLGPRRRHHAHSNIETKRQFLCDQLGRIRNLHVHNGPRLRFQRRQHLRRPFRISNIFGRAVAQGAQRNGQLGIVNGHRSARRTERDLGPIRPPHEGLGQKPRQPVAHNGVAVHLANLQAPLIAAPPRRLMRHHLFSSLAARLPLVLHHVLEAHSIHGPQKDGGGNLLPRRAIVQNLIAVLFVALLF